MLNHQRVHIIICHIKCQYVPIYSDKIKNIPFYSDYIDTTICNIRVINPILSRPRHGQNVMGSANWFPWKSVYPKPTYQHFFNILIYIYINPIEYRYICHKLLCLQTHLKLTEINYESTNLLLIRTISSDKIPFVRGTTRY